MADQGTWFKLWCSSSDDPDLDNLSVDDFGRWCKLGALTKAHGTDGALVLRPPARSLCAQLQVADFDALLSVLHRLPHVSVTQKTLAVSSETDVMLQFDNWRKYQGDFSTPRVKKMREMKRIRREEKRREEKLDSSSLDSSPSLGSPGVQKGKTRQQRKDRITMSSGFDRFWSSYPHRVGKDKAWEAWQKRGCEPITREILEGLERTMPHITREGGKFMPLPATWLNQGRWKDEPVAPSLVLTPKTSGNLEAARQAIEEHERRTQQGRA